MLPESKAFWEVVGYHHLYKPSVGCSKVIHDDEYLTETRLGEILDQIFGKVIRQHKVKIDSHNYKIDFLVRLGDRDVFIEFDGPRHYTNTTVYQRDLRVKEFCKTNKIKFIQIPYWIQLNTHTFEQFFGIEITKKYLKDKGIEITTSYPCGFINKYAVRPMDFCVLGLSRFISEYLHCNSSFADDKDVEFWSTIQQVFHSLNDTQNSIQTLASFGDVMKNIHKDFQAFEHYPT